MAEPVFRVSLCIPSLNGGGAERIMVVLANAMAKRGFAVDLVVTRAQGPYLKDVVPGVRIVDFGAARMMNAFLPLVWYLRRERPTVLLSFMTHTNIGALLARRVSGVPMRVVISEHCTISVSYEHARSHWGRGIAKLTRWVYPLADGICTVSKAASADLARFAHLSPDRVQTIYNPFDLARIHRQSQDRLDHPWFCAGAPPVLLAVGRLEAEKDYETLIEGFRIMHERCHARLLVLGEGSLRPVLENRVRQGGLTANEVQMPGFVQNPFAYLSRCAMFVLSSRWEGLPSVLIEAMACGAPVVSTDCPSGPNEILEGGRWGRLVPVGDPDALAEAMQAVLETPSNELPDVRGRAQDFEQERAVDAYLKIMGLPLYPASEEKVDAG